MNDCESFESRYIDWKQGRLNSAEGETLARHAVNCRHCSSIGQGEMNISHLLRNQPVYRPRNGFELRLENSIKAVENNGKPIRLVKEVSLIPRLTALGAGLASGLAVGIFVLTAPVGDTGTMPISAVAPGATQLVADNSPQVKEKSEDSLFSRRDSAAKVDSHYLVGDYGKVVSGR